jgi:hypothetical protein
MIELSGNIENVNFKIIKEWALLAKKKVEDNRTWLNKHIYKKLFQNNIHLISGIIKNIVVSVKTVEETNSKLEEESLKSKILNTNKAFDEKEFSKWVSDKIQWDNKKKLKIEAQKDLLLKKENEEISKFHQPNIHLKNKTKTHKSENDVFNKLYNNKDQKQEKLIQKIKESLPEFKPSITKKLPHYIIKKNLENENIANLYHTNAYQKNTLQSTIDKEENINTNIICKTDRKLQTINTFTIYSEDECDEEDIKLGKRDLISQYKQALELADKIKLIEKKKKK